jgi:hypothetical protein
MPNDKPGAKFKNIMTRSFIVALISILLLHSCKKGITFWPEEITDDGLMIGYSDAYNLISFYNRKNLMKDTSQLGLIIRNLNETSNPV